MTAMSDAFRFMGWGAFFSFMMGWDAFFSLDLKSHPMCLLGISICSSHIPEFDDRSHARVFTNAGYPRWEAGPD